jgi:hypothetical protein
MGLFKNNTETETETEAINSLPSTEEEILTERMMTPPTQDLTDPVAAKEYLIEQTELRGGVLIKTGSGAAADFIYAVLDKDTVSNMIYSEKELSEPRQASALRSMQNAKDIIQSQSCLPGGGTYSRAEYYMYNLVGAHIHVTDQKCELGKIKRISVNLTQITEMQSVDDLNEIFALITNQETNPEAKIDLLEISQ